MIPTKLRSKISGELSFPLGAKEISEVLEGVPQYASLTLAYYPHWDKTPACIRKILDSGESLCVMEARYRNVRPGRSGSQMLQDMGWYDETWELAVYPIPRNKRSATKTLLLAEGLPRIRAWLEMERPGTWRDGHHSCRLMVRFAEEGILLCEHV